MRCTGLDSTRAGWQYREGMPVLPVRRYFRWAELLYLRAHILEKKTRLEKQIRLTEVAEG